MPEYLTIILSILLGGIGGAIGGALLNHYLNRSQSNKERLRSITTESYCEKLLDPLSQAVSQTYFHMRVLDYERINKLKTECNNFAGRMDNVGGLGRLANFPEGYQHIPMVSRALLEDYSILRRLQLIQNNKTPEDIEERLQENIRMIEEMIDIIDSTSDRIRIIVLPNDLRDIPVAIMKDEFILEKKLQLKDLRIKAVSFSKEKVLNIR